MSYIPVPPPVPGRPPSPDGWYFAVTMLMGLLLFGLICGVAGVMVTLKGSWCWLGPDDVLVDAGCRGSGHLVVGTPCP